MGFRRTCPGIGREKGATPIKGASPAWAHTFLIRILLNYWDSLDWSFRDLGLVLKFLAS